MCVSGNDREREEEEERERERKRERERECVYVVYRNIVRNTSTL